MHSCTRCGCPVQRAVEPGQLRPTSPARARQLMRDGLAAHLATVHQLDADDLAHAVDVQLGKQR